MSTTPISTNLTVGRVYRFWLPLAATWLMMSAEGPLLAALIARLPDPKYNLAAYGVAFSLGLLLEAPIIMIMSASTALVEDRVSYLRLRNFTTVLNVAMTASMVVLLVPLWFKPLMNDVVGLPEAVTNLTHSACLLFLPWPACIGYRRFYQGILIRAGKTRWVAYGTVIRLSCMVATAFSLFHFSSLDGASIGMASLSVGVFAEAVASRLMVRAPLRKILSGDPVEKARGSLGYHDIIRFYYPLALTSILTLGVHPVVTFFMGQGRAAVESLAVFPVVNVLIFIFRSFGLAFQEVGIALMGEKKEGYPALRNFATLLGMGTILGLGLVAFTPLGRLWFEGVSGLTPDLSRLAYLPTQILFFIPGLTVLLCFQRAILVHARETRPITWATLIEVAGIVIVLWLGIYRMDAVGVDAAAWAFIAGRIGANLYLVRPVNRAIRGN